ncbi:tripartite tricarboxylate transporter permease [Methylobacterium ajmalii]|uniref:Tripartite tricarboxylate transporter permease n=1 Tax=Methylobacterium ajmalii TaxID=2738439 RepID=A0ABV0A4K1_9HYPH
MDSTVANLIHGFSIALQPHNFLFSLVGVLIGNLIGVLPGMGIMATISILLPLTFGMPPVAAILMLAGIYYGAQYGGAICSILLNLPCHPSHAVTCLDGYPMTRQGRGGVALGITMLASFFGAAFGIVQMILFAPLLVRIAFQFGPAEISTLMLLGLLAGATLARGSALKGVAMTLVGLTLGCVGSDLDTGTSRFTFGVMSLYNGIDLVAVALGFFGIAEFLKSINRLTIGDLSGVRVRMRDMRPSRADLRESALPILRGTLIGSLCSLIPGTGPTIASFIAYAAEKRVSRHTERFGGGAIGGVASPEASTHSSVQGDFVPTMSLGIPGDAVMALILGALIIQGITPGPQLMTEHPDVFWGLIASFWIGNILLVLLNVPLIGIWVRLLQIPFRFLYPCALFFICVGVYSTNNEMFGVLQTLVIGIVGYGLMRLGFHPAPVLLGFVLGPRLEENFRRALLLSRGDPWTFVGSPISATFVALAVLLVGMQVVLAWRGRRRSRMDAVLAGNERGRRMTPAEAPAVTGSLEV